MKTATCGKVVSDVLMAIQAQSSLFFPVEWLVTGRALRLEFGMATNEIAGHDKRLNSLSNSRGTCETDYHQHESCQTCTPFIHFWRSATVG